MNRATVLVVEDDVSVRAMIVRAFCETYDVHRAADAENALRLAHTLPHIDIVICDVGLPKTDGLTLVRAIRAMPRMKHVAVLFLSARTSPREIAEGMSAGAQMYLTKPFRVDDLRQRVGRLVARGATLVPMQQVG